MSNYIAGTIAVLLIGVFLLLGLEVYSLLSAHHAVSAAAWAAEPALHEDGGLSPRVRQVVAANLAAAQLDPDRMQLTGTSPGAAPGELVYLEVRYPQPYRLLQPGRGPLLRNREGTALIRRRITTTSGAAGAGP